MRALVVSDIHANIVALEAVLAAAPSVDEVWQLGDVVGYGPEPDAVVERLLGLGAVGVRGNHDAAAVGGDEIAAFNLDARRAMEWTRSAIAAPTRDWLAALPERLVRGDWTLVHGSPRDPIWEYVMSSGVARAALADLETPFGMHGHTHVPIGWLDEDDGVGTVSPAADSVLDLGERRALLNPGSVGQPRDGIPAASWMVIDTDAGTATWHRTAYDIAAVQAAMEALDFPSRLVERLSYGL